MAPSFRVWNETVSQGKVYYSNASNAWVGFNDPYWWLWIAGYTLVFLCLSVFYVYWKNKYYSPPQVPGYKK